MYNQCTTWICKTQSKNVLICFCIETHDCVPQQEQEIATNASCGQYASLICVFLLAPAAKTAWFQSVCFPVQWSWVNYWFSFPRVFGRSALITSRISESGKGDLRQMQTSIFSICFCIHSHSNHVAFSDSGFYLFLIFRRPRRPDDSILARWPLHWPPAHHLRPSASVSSSGDNGM